MGGSLGSVGEVEGEVVDRFIQTRIPINTKTNAMTMPHIQYVRFENVVSFEGMESS